MRLTLCMYLFITFQHFVALFFLVILGNILNGKIGYYGQYNDRALKFFATFGLGQERVQNLAVLFVL